ncbi:MAG: glycerophosphodiester phosphodiesterase [Firmicutes bacterium]|nr:glycerophosphodiester phosphodiesterase [Bacillota bacterium]
MYKLIAHRGNKKSSKENTLAAFFDAVNSSDYVGFECDVRQSKDNKFVIYHDPLFQGKLIKNYYYQDLKKYDIPLLGDVLDIKTDKIIMVDIKDPFIDTEKLVRELNKYSDKKIYVMSFYDNAIIKLFNDNRTYKVGILNYVLNTDEKHFNYDFLCILGAISNDKIIKNYKIKGKELFIYGVKKTNLKDFYPYYIVD